MSTCVVFGIRITEHGTCYHAQSLGFYQIARPTTTCTRHDREPHHAVCHPSSLRVDTTWTRVVLSPASYSNHCDLQAMDRRERVEEAAPIFSAVSPDPE